MAYHSDALGDGVSDDTLSIRAALVVVFKNCLCFCIYYCLRQNSDCDIVLLSAPGNYLSGMLCLNFTIDVIFVRLQVQSILQEIIKCFVSKQVQHCLRQQRSQTTPLLTLSPPIR